MSFITASPSGTELPSTWNRPEITNSMENESNVWSSEVPEKFYLKRTSYCDQEDDEDRTDMEGIKDFT